VTLSRPSRPLTRRELLSLAGSEAEPGHWLRVFRRAMACRFEVTLGQEDARHVPAAREALDEVERVERMLTVFSEASEVARVNREAAQRPVPVSEGLFALLERCRELHAATGGAFDPTATPLSRCWGFLERRPALPAPAAIAAALTAVGFEKLELDGEARSVRYRRPGLSLNFGSIGKGYALDRAAELLRQRGVGRALLSGGHSSVLALGAEPFPVDLRSPRLPGVLARLRLGGAALGTSGAGEQFFEAEGRRYGHLIDPRTGWPAQGVLSASVATASAADADALSTAFLVGGAELAARCCAERPGTLALLVPEAEPDRPARFGACPGAELQAG
jgi:thiamine biosynthesis lipoprotein